jgi:hypothetical protein
MFRDVISWYDKERGGVPVTGRHARFENALD